MKTRKWKDITEDIEEIKEAIAKVKNSSIPESEKNQMLEDIGKIMNKLKNQGIAIFTDAGRYQIIEELGKGDMGNHLWCILYTKSPENTKIRDEKTNIPYSRSCTT